MLYRARPISGRSQAKTASGRRAEQCAAISLAVMLICGLAFVVYVFFTLAAPLTEGIW